MKYSLRSLMIVALVVPPFLGVVVWLLTILSNLPKTETFKPPKFIDYDGQKIPLEEFEKMQRRWEQERVESRRAAP